MKKAEKQEYVREVVAVGVFVVALCAVCAFMNGQAMCLSALYVKEGKSDHLMISGDRIFLCLGFCGRGEKFLCGFRKIFHGRGNPFLPVIKNKQIHFDIKACYGKESEIFFLQDR